MRDANLGWMCQRVLGREREGHGGCSQHRNGGQGISCRLPGPRGLGTGLACARCSCRPSVWEMSGPHPCGHTRRGLECGSASQGPVASSGGAAACRSCAMAVSGLAAHRAFAAARLLLIISVFAQSGLVAGVVQQSSSLLHVPDCVSEYLLKCFPQHCKHI